MADTTAVQHEEVVAACEVPIVEVGLYAVGAVMSGRVVIWYLHAWPRGPHINEHCSVWKTYLMHTQCGPWLQRPTCNYMNGQGICPESES